MRATRRLLPAIAALLSLAACTPNQMGGMQQPTGFAGGYGYGQNACDTHFRVVNASHMPVGNLFYSHSSRPAWGRDQLGQNMLPPGSGAMFQAIAPGAHDFRVVMANGAPMELRQVDVCRARQITVTDYGLRVS